MLTPAPPWQPNHHHRGGAPPGGIWGGRVRTGSRIPGGGGGTEPGAGCNAGPRTDAAISAAEWRNAIVLTLGPPLATPRPGRLIDA
ncbi:hypothetical protein GCM10012275_60770 [Longimycelium tulufanense]|uniref:Uncharacterized protein n=1 Tax=Longimycelium tulufanense TaxID=907463 RepID=A0A8J3CEJ0_9PSEU|nr:hypothetical protein GCM10012275_60770 [Longimycelium tulufanense]